LDSGTFRFTGQVDIEIDSESKPGCVAETVTITCA